MILLYIVASSNPLYFIGGRQLSPVQHGRVHHSWKGAGNESSKCVNVCIAVELVSRAPCLSCMLSLTQIEKRCWVDIEIFRFVLQRAARYFDSHHPRTWWMTRNRKCSFNEDQVPAAALR